MAETTCVSDCTVMEDGDYQACDTCTGFVTCSSSRLIRQTCGPWGQKWDDNLKECVWESETCSKSGHFYLQKYILG